MKSKRNLYVLSAAVVVCSLFAEGLAESSFSGIGVGRGFVGLLRHSTLAALMCCFFGAMGVIWVGWYWLKLAEEITSIAGQFKQQQPASTKLKRFFALFRMIKINELRQVINDNLKNNTDRIAELDGQIKDLQMQIQLSQGQRKNTEAIIYSIRDAVIVIDEFDRLLVANEAAGEIFNFDCRNSKYKPINSLTGEDKKEFVDFLCQSRQNKIRATRREIAMTADEPDLPQKIFDCIVSCVYDLEEQVCGAVAVLHDVTREKEISRMKNDFVNHVSHELKTPLASICAYSEMLLDGEAKDETARKEFCSVIQSQGKRLNKLIEDLLNTSRIETGLTEVSKSQISVTILIEEQLKMIKRFADGKNIKIIGQKPIVFEQVYADKALIEQVVINLLSNAVKYTPAGGSVKIKTEVDEVANTVRVSVTDTGVGIPQGEIEHVFDKFYRVGANKKQAEGTGLGLNLVKQIVEKVHNGRVFVKSRVGEGSTFGFELPLSLKSVAVG